MNNIYDSNYNTFSPVLYALAEKDINLSPRAIIAYNFVLGRFNMSAKNKHRFSDEKGVFIYFTNDELERLLKCSRPTVTAVIKELLSAGLLERESKKSPKFYVKPIGIQSKSSANSEPNDTKSYSQRDASFDVELATRIAESSVPDFDTKKRRKSAKRIKV